MQHTTDKPRLIEIEIRFNPKLILEYVTSRHGLLRHLAFIITTFLWISISFGLQLSLPTVFPAYPWLPAAWGTAYLASRRSSVCAIFCAFVIGLCLDAVCFNPLGPASIVLTAVVLICRFISTKLPHKYFFKANTLLLSIASTAIFVFGKVFFCCPLAAFATKIALLPKYLIGGILLAIPACFFTFAVKDIIESFLRVDDDTQESSAEG